MEMTASLLVLVILLGLFMLIRYHWRRRELYCHMAKIPGPRSWPIIGNSLDFYGVRTKEDAIKALLKNATNNDSPGIIRKWILQTPVIIVTDPDIIQTLANHPSATSKDELVYGQLKKVAGEGIFTSNGERWYRMRKELVRHLQTKSQHEFEKIISRRLETLCKVLDTMADNRTAVNLHHQINLFTLDLIVETTMGMDTLNETESNSYNFPAIVYQAIVAGTITTVTLRALFGFETSHLLDEICDKLTRITKDILRHRMANLASAEPTGKKSFTDSVIAIGQLEGLDFEETSKLAVDLLIAGSDTSSLVMAVALLMIAVHQDIQDRILQELSDIFGGSNRPAEENDLRHMEYLEMCLNESLRHSGVPVTGRHIDSDIVLDDYTIPAGSVLILALQSPMKNAKYWERPDSFYPEHFTSDAVRLRPKGAFLPFHTGPRRCPGKAYSFQVMKRTISTILRRYHLTTDTKFHEIRYEYHLLTIPMSPLVTLTKR